MKSKVHNMVFDALSERIEKGTIIELNLKANTKETDIKGTTLIDAMEILYEYDNGMRETSNYFTKGAYKGCRDRFFSIHHPCYDSIPELCKCGVLKELEGFSALCWINVETLRQIREKLDKATADPIVVDVVDGKQSAKYVIPAHDIAIRKLMKMLSVSQQKQLKMALNRTLERNRDNSANANAVTASTVTTSPTDSPATHSLSLSF